MNVTMLNDAEIIMMALVFMLFKCDLKVLSYGLPNIPNMQLIRVLLIEMVAIYFYTTWCAPIF